MLFYKIKAAFAEKASSFDVIKLHTIGMRHEQEDEIVYGDGKAEVSKYEIGHEKKRTLLKRAVCGADVVLKLLNDCGITAWDGFYGPHPKRIRDGTMFDFKATVNGKRISAHGSQNFPPHYRDFRDGLYDIYEKYGVNIENV